MEVSSSVQDRDRSNRQTDAWVAERVMGMTFVDPYWRNKSDLEHRYAKDGFSTPSQDLPRYSSDIAAAFKVLRKFNAWFLSKDGDHFRCELVVKLNSNIRLNEEFTNYRGYGGSEPAAICDAALKATGG